MVARAIASVRECTPSLWYSARLCDRIVFGGEEQALTDLAVDRSLARRLRTASSASLGGSSSCAARRAAARRSELLLHLVGERGNWPAVDELAERLLRGAQRRLGLGETTAPQTDAGQHDEQPRLMHGRDLITKEAFSGGELVLGLDQASLGG